MEFVIAKISQANDMLIKLQNFTPENVLLRIYFHMEICITLRGWQHFSVSLRACLNCFKNTNQPKL